MTAVCVICSSILSDVNLGGSSPPIWMTITRNTVTTLVSEATVLLTTYLWYFALLLAFQGLLPPYITCSNDPTKKNLKHHSDSYFTRSLKSPPQCSQSSQARSRNSASSHQEPTCDSASQGNGRACLIPLPYLKVP